MYVEDGAARWPLAQRWWVGGETRCLGAATRAKQVLFVKAKVYSVALYVEGKPAARELGLRARGGFLSPPPPGDAGGKKNDRAGEEQQEQEQEADLASALCDGAFAKVLAVRLLRDVTGDQFAEAIGAALAPRARLTGAGGALEQYVGFLSRQTLKEGTQIANLWTADGEELQVQVSGAAAAAAAAGGGEGAVDWETRAPALTVASPSLARGLFEVYLGGTPLVPEARAAWARGARLLLDSDDVKRATDKEGGSAFW
jgi:hypothetical protein